MSATKIIGFTILRNAIKYDYPFRESLRSLCGLCERVIVAVGASEDDTLAAVKELAADLPIDIIQTEWDESKREGGLVLSEQTNIALTELRRRYTQGWAFYLQADEVLCESEYGRIRRDLDNAERAGADCLRLRYLHFWQSYDRIAIGLRWYPQETRAIRIDAETESYGDAQSFRGCERSYESDAHVFHYGHVREASAYAAKKRDFHRWWHSDADLPAILSKGESRDRKTETLKYLGPHPEVMRERQERHGFQVPPEPAQKLVVYGDPGAYPSNFLAALPASQLQWTQKLTELKQAPPERAVVLQPLPWHQHLLTGFRFRSRVPLAMRSPQARPWRPEFCALLRFSERNVPVRVL